MNAPMRNTDADETVRANAFAVSADELRKFVERFEMLDADKAIIARLMAEVIMDAKGRGYDTKAFRAVIKVRKVQPNVQAEFESIIEVYKSALGM